MGLSVESKLHSTDGHFSTFTIVLSKGTQKRCITIFEVSDWNEHVNYQPDLLAKMVVTIGNRFLQQKSKSFPPLVMSSNGSGRCGSLLFLLVLSVVEQNRAQTGNTQNPLSIYSTLQNSRNLLIQSKLAIPALSMFNFYNSFV